MRNGVTGGEAGIRTLGRAFGPYNGLANRRLQPLGHLTAEFQVYDYWVGTSRFSSSNQFNTTTSDVAVPDPERFSIRNRRVSVCHSHPAFTPPNDRGEQPTEQSLSRPTPI